MSTYTSSELSTKLIRILSSSGPRYGAKQTDAEVCQQVHRLVRDLHEGYSGFVSQLSLRWEQNWGVGATLTVSVRSEENLQPRGATSLPSVCLTCKADISWSSCGRSIADATAAVALYREVIELAALVEATLDGATLRVGQEEGA